MTKTCHKIALLLLASLGLIHQAQAATVAVQPAVTSATVGDSIALELWALGFPALDGGSLTVTYPAGAISVPTVTVNPFWSLSLSSGITSVPGTVADIDFGALAFPAPSGDLLIATLTATALAPVSGAVIGLSVGSNPFSGNAALLTPGADFAVQNGQLDVHAVPLPAAAWMLFGGLGMLGGFGLRRRA